MAAGDPAALGALHERWTPLLHGLALRILHDPEEAAAVVEETLWQAWRQAPRHGDARATVATWLTTIAHRRALHRLRARRRAQERDDAHPPAAPPLQLVREEPPATDDAAERAPATAAATPGDERRARAAAALDALPPWAREPIVLAYLDGLALAEIAPRLGMPPDAVAMRIRQGMERLRAGLDAPRGG
jgi:RNA polymerase sigma-70 factor (ECF subfamily)